MTPQRLMVERCDIRGCNGTATVRFHTEDGARVVLCPKHSTIVPDSDKAAR